MRERKRTRSGFNIRDMKTLRYALAALLLVAVPVHADEGEKKPAAEKKAAKKSDKNIFQKAESNTGYFLNRNNIWTRHSDDKKKKKE